MFKSRNTSYQPSAEVSIDDFILPANIIDFPRSQVIPGGYYFSEITNISVRLSNKGKKCLDVVYHLEGYRGGEYDMRLSYPERSQALQDFYAAMLKSGVPSGSRIDAAVGVTERIHLVYDDEDSIGYIRARAYDPITEEELPDEDATNEASEETD